MTLSKRERDDLRRVMGVSEEELSVLPCFRPKERRLNGFGEHLDTVLQGLDLRRGMVVLDLPCGQGGVSVPLAEKYGVTVVGYDLLPNYVDYANAFAAERGVEALTTFSKGDIRQTVKRLDGRFDLLLWVAAPHVWGQSRQTIEALRGLLKDEGVIVIADAYRLKDGGAADGLETYETLEDTCRGYGALGDEIVSLDDYGTSLWEEDYRYTKRGYLESLERTESMEDKRKIKQIIDNLDDEERFDRAHLGCAIWTIRVHKGR